jgi:hypothetical protein
MMPFSAASVSVAALEISLSPLDIGLYAYHAVIRMDVTMNARNAPKLVSLLLAQIQLDEPDIVFTDGDDKRIDNDDLPTEKLTFDATFGVSTNCTSLNCHPIINSSRTFHQIKIGVWQILQQHRIFLDKSSGPISKRDLVPMGFYACPPGLRQYPGVPQSAKQRHLHQLHFLDGRCRTEPTNRLL